MPTEPAARPAQYSLVLVQPTGALVTAALVLGSLFLLLNALKLVGSPTGRSLASGLLGLGLLLGAGYRRVRGNQLRLLRFDRAALYLEPLGPGPPAETIALASIRAYSYWVRLLRWRVFTQCHLRLELTDGRVLHLADRPGPHPDAPPGTVQLDVLARRLARRTKLGPRRRPLFFQTRPARVLLWISGVAAVAGLGLLVVGYEAGLGLLYPAAGYAASYYLGYKEDPL